MSYEGWTNYETWCVKLWLDNEEGTYHEVTDAARERAEAARDDEEEPSKSEFADWLKQYVEDLHEEQIDALSGTMLSDLLRAALSEVDWFEIAGAYLNDAKEEVSSQ